MRMQRRTIILFVVLISIFLAFRFCNSGKEKKSEPERQDPLSMQENSGEFNRSFSAMLNSYYELKDALVASDTAGATAAAAKLATAASALKLEEIKGDTTGAIRETAGFFAQTISSSSASVAGGAGIDDKRRTFETISDALWSLTRTVRYDGQKVFYQYCPMAFDNKGAYWLNDAREIRNPYFGDKMLKCGEVADSLDYSKR